MNAIEVDHLTKKFGQLVAVNEVSFQVAQREIFGLLGPNGAGKTTLIRILTTLTPPTSGTARVSGHDICDDPDGVRRTLGVIPQAFTSDPNIARLTGRGCRARVLSAIQTFLKSTLFKLSLDEQSGNSCIRPE
jgi:ABC-type multidrug transport system ATPase subunit